MTRLATVINKIIDLINTKQATLVSGENIKKLNGTDIVGSGNIPVKTVGGESILGDGDVEIIGTGTLTTTSQNVIGAINELDTDKAEQADLTTLTDRVSTAEGDIDALDTRVTQAEAAVGTPLVASTVAGMTDKTKIYVYTGSETGYTSGNWYYWNGTAWTSGGVYNSTAFETDTTLAISGKAADAKVTGDKITDLKSDLGLVIESYDTIEHYLYRKDAYINYPTGAITSQSGYNIYKIPVEELDVFSATWIDGFAPDLSGNYAIIAGFSDDTYETFSGGVKQYGLRSNSPNFLICVGGIANFSDVYFNVKSGNENKISFQLNLPYMQLSNDVVASKVVDQSNTVVSQIYLGASGFGGHFNSPYRNFYLKLSEGDIILFNKTVPNVGDRRGFYIDSDGVTTVITDYAFTAPKDCVIDIYDNSDIEGSFEYIPVNSIKIASRDIIGDGKSQFEGLDGVAFGTSLTYRSISSYGYLTTLESLSGVEFDNQGVGSSYIYGDGGQYDMLAKVKAYTGYSGKRVGILEGFVNDWYGNRTLGTWKDTTETSVCGCVRSALNYMLSQNANMTVFLILDHYGRNYSIDCSSTAVNGAGLTQYEFYSEIAKVAESLGIPVIREFEDSGISENTPQYLTDNIHCNQLGAVQSGYAIWYQMKQYQLNRA